MKKTVYLTGFLAVLLIGSAIYGTIFKYEPLSVMTRYIMGSFWAGVAVFLHKTYCRPSKNPQKAQ